MAYILHFVIFVLGLVSASPTAARINCSTSKAITCATEYCATKLDGRVPRTTTTYKTDLTTTIVTTLTPTTTVIGQGSTVTTTVIQTASVATTLSQSTVTVPTTSTVLKSSITTTSTRIVTQTVGTALTLSQSTLIVPTTSTITTLTTTTSTRVITQTNLFSTTVTTRVVTTEYPSCVTNANMRKVANTITPAAAGTTYATKDSKEVYAKAVRDESDEARNGRFPKIIRCTKNVTRITTIYSTQTASTVTVYSGTAVSTVTATTTTTTTAVVTPTPITITSTIVVTSDGGTVVQLVTRTTTTTNTAVVTPNPITRTSTFLVRTTSTSRSTTSTTTTLSSTNTIVTTTYSTVVIGATSGTPSVFLPSPTAIVGNVQQGSPGNYDDIGYWINLPFPVVFYGVSNSTLFVSINGFFSLDDLGTNFTSYTEYPLPVATLPANTICAFWDDLYIFNGTAQGLYYEVDGTAPRRTLTIEWYMSHYQDPTQYYHFAAIYQEAVPNVIEFIYLDVSDNGVSALVGAQSTTTNQFTQYSYDQPIIYPGLQLRYNITSNTFVQGGIPPCPS